MIDAVKREHAVAPFDILHAQYGYPTGWAVLLAAAEIDVPCVVSIQGGDGHWVGSCCETHYQAFRRVLDHAGALLIGGESFISEVSGAHERAALARFTRVPGAVDTTSFKPGHEIGSGVGSSTPPLPRAGSTGEKGVLDFIEAVGLLREWGVPYRATISGIGPDVDAARGLAASLRFTPTELRFTGGTPYAATPAIYAAADIFASPTYSEGFFQHDPRGDGVGVARGQLRGGRRDRLPAPRRQWPAHAGRRRHGPRRDAAPADRRRAPAAAHRLTRPRGLPRQLFLGSGRAPRPSMSTRNCAAPRPSVISRETSSRAPVAFASIPTCC